MTKSIILPGQKTPGWPKQRKVQKLQTDDLSTILDTAWREDVHFVQYAVIEEIGPYRYNNEIFAAPEFDEVRQGNDGISMIAVVFDVDSPAKKSGSVGAIDVWFDDERPKIAKLLADHPGLVWRTRGGWRGVWTTSRKLYSTDDTAVWRKDYLAALSKLEDTYGIIVDAACNDWNRLHRVPWGKREGEPKDQDPIQYERIGSFGGGIDLSTFSTHENRQEARRRFLSAWKAPPQNRQNKNENPSDHNTLPSFVGESVWHKLLSARGLVLGSLGPGKYSVRCPNEHNHSTAGNETSTVLYDPGPGEVHGHIWCSHHHCAGLDWRGLLGIQRDEWTALTKTAINECEVADGTAMPIVGPVVESFRDLERKVVSELIPDAIHNHKPAGIASNVAHLLTHHPIWKGCFAYDTFLHNQTWARIPEFLKERKKETVVVETDALEVQGWLLRGNGFDQRPPIAASIEACINGIKLACRLNQSDSLRDQVLKLDGVWDGEARLDSWVVDYVGAEDNELNRAIGKKWLIAAVARAMDPGCVADMMVILEGEQEVGKNYLLEILFDKKYIVVPYGLKVGSKDFDQKTADSWCVHDDELSCMLSTGIEPTKSWISIRTMKYRKAHDKDFTTVDRRFIPVGSTNRKGYLSDEENRRFWPIVMKKLQDEALKRDRDQLMSEAFAYYRLGTNYRIQKENAYYDLLAVVHDSKQEDNVMEEQIQRWLDNGDLVPPLKLLDVFRALDVRPDRWTDGRLVQSVSSALRRCGLVNPKRRDGRVWIRATDVQPHWSQK